MCSTACAKGARIHDLPAIVSVNGGAPVARSSPASRRSSSNSGRQTELHVDDRPRARAVGPCREHQTLAIVLGVLFDREAQRQKIGADRF